MRRPCRGAECARCSQRDGARPVIGLLACGAGLGFLLLGANHSKWDKIYCIVLYCIALYCIVLYGLEITDILGANLSRNNRMASQIVDIYHLQRNSLIIKKN